MFVKPTLPARATTTPLVVAMAVMAFTCTFLLWRRRRIPRQRPLRTKQLNVIPQTATLHVALDTGRIFSGSNQVSSATIGPTYDERLLVAYIERTSSHPKLMDFEGLTGCRYTPHLMFERQTDLLSVHTWAMPPPCSPQIPFGSVPSAKAAGCESELRTNCWPLLESLVVKPIGAHDAHKVGLGVFAAAPLPPGAVLCEYTGLVQVDPVTSALEADDYAYALPTCDPNVVISAKEMGGLARLLNHGNRPNCELRTVHIDGFLHVVCFTLQRTIEPDVQLLINYGEPYWKNERRSPHRVDL